MISRRRFVLTACLGPLIAQMVRARGTDETVIALSREPTSLDPREAYSAYARTLVEQVYQTVLRRTDGAVTPPIARSCTPVKSDKLRWILELERDYRFHNGDPVDSSAVAYSLEHSPSRWPKNITVKTQRRDAFSLELSTNIPYTPLPDRLCDVFVVPKGYYDGSQEEVQKRLQTNPNGSGEYRLEGWARGAYIALRRFDDYKGKKPVVAKLVYRFMEKSSQVVAQKTGEIDITDDPPSTEFRDALKQAGIRVVEGPGAIVFVGWNTFTVPDPRVRIALSLALDRKAVANVHAGTVVESILSPEAQASPRDVAWLQYDIKRAAGLLKEANRLPALTLAVPQELATVGEVVASQWKAVAISARLEVASTSELSTRLLQKKAPEAYVLRTASYVDPDITLSRFVMTDGPLSMFKKPDADRLINDAREHNDRGRSEIYRKLQELLRGDPPFVPLFREQQFHGVAKWIDWRPRTDGLILGRDIGVKK